MATCINLHEPFGEKYRLGCDPAYIAEHGKLGRIDDPWLLTIRCKFGEIYPWGGDRIAFGSAGRGSTANKVAALPFVRIEQDADDGVTVSFHVDHFAEVAAIVKPKRRRAGYRAIIRRPLLREALARALVGQPVLNAKFTVGLGSRLHKARFTSSANYPGGNRMLFSL